MAQRQIFPFALLSPSGGFLFFYLPANRDLNVDDLKLISLQLLDASSVNVHTKCKPCTGESIGSQLFYQVVENTGIIFAIVETFM